MTGSHPLPTIPVMHTNGRNGHPANNFERELGGRLYSAGAAFGKLWCRGSTEDPRCGGRGWSRRKRLCLPATNRYLVWRVPPSSSRGAVSKRYYHATIGESGEIPDLVRGGRSGAN